MNASHATPSAFSAIQLVSRGVFIELLRKKDLYVLAILMGIYSVGVVAFRVVGIDNPSTATFLLNLGLTLAFWAAHILAILLSARQVPDEIEHRTLYPLLAKPLSRASFIIGKWAASAASGMACLVALGTLAWICAPHSESYNTLTLVQVLLLGLLSVAMVSAIALALSVMAPRAVALVVAALLYFAAARIAGLAVNLSGASDVVNWLTAYLPDFSKLNLVTRYTDGVDPVTAVEFLGLFLYAAVFTAFPIVLACKLFERRPL